MSDDITISDTTNCPACGMPWIDHPGHATVCRELQEAKRERPMTVREAFAVAVVEAAESKGGKA